MSKSSKELLAHILKECIYLAQVSKDLTEAEFLHNETLQRAFERSLEIIGEAVKNLPPEFISDHSDIGWSEIAKMRDRLIHHYFGTDHEIVWEVVTKEVPELKTYIESIDL